MTTCMNCIEFNTQVCTTSIQFHCKVELLSELKKASILGLGWQTSKLGGLPPQHQWRWGGRDQPSSEPGSSKIQRAPELDSWATFVLTYSSPLNMKKAKVLPTNPDIWQLLLCFVSHNRVNTRTIVNNNVKTWTIAQTIPEFLPMVLGSLHKARKLPWQRIKICTVPLWERKRSVKAGEAPGHSREPVHLSQ